MKFTKVFLLSAATTLVASLSSCTDNDLGFTANSIQFEKNFVERFGNIDPNQNWGFGELPSISTRGVKTRADRYGDKIVVDRNEWTMNTGYIQADDAMYIEIPGWPNFDGRYYGAISDGNNLNIISNDVPSTYMPAGDLTDYEIDYVSRWFRENPNPTSDPIELKDFFIQNVSRDVDRVHLEGDNANYRNGVIANSKYSYELDHLDFYRPGSDPVHVQAYNCGNTNNMGAFESFPIYAYGNDDADKALYSDGLDRSTNYRRIQYVRFEGVNDFTCQSSHADVPETKTLSPWVLKHLTWREPGPDGKMHDREGWYLAFDYYSENQSSGETVGRDGYYSNWIIKISPAVHIPVPTPESYSARVMCEDLGTTDDFDFNDVVFDVYYEGTESPYIAHITLQAAGGTLPLYIGDMSHEVHKLFGFNDCSEMINTGAGPTKDPVSFTLETLSTDPNDIPVIVENPNQQNATYELKSATGKAPQKFCVPSIVSWAKERVDIQDAYPFFNKWVNDATTWTAATESLPSIALTNGTSSVGYSCTDYKGNSISGSAIPLQNNSKNVWYTLIDGQASSNTLYKYAEMKLSISSILNGGSAAGPVTLWSGNHNITWGDNSIKITDVKKIVDAFDKGMVVRVWGTPTNPSNYYFNIADVIAFPGDGIYDSTKGYAQKILIGIPSEALKNASELTVEGGNFTVTKIEITKE